MITFITITENFAYIIYILGGHFTIFFFRHFLSMIAFVFYTRLKLNLAGSKNLNGNKNISMKKK